MQTVCDIPRATTNQIKFSQYLQGTFSSKNGKCRYFSVARDKKALHRRKQCLGSDSELIAVCLCFWTHFQTPLAQIQPRVIKGAASVLSFQSPINFLILMTPKSKCKQRDFLW